MDLLLNATSGLRVLIAMVSLSAMKLKRTHHISLDMISNKKRMTKVK